MHLADLCSIRSGLTLRQRLDDVREGGVLAVQQGDLTPAGEFLTAKAIRIDVPTRSTHRIGSDELVFRSRGPFWSAWAPGEFGEPIVAVAPLFILTPAPDIDPAFLAWYIGQPTAQRFFVAESMGSGVQMIPRSVLERLPLQLPPLDQQRAIAAAATLASRERALSRRLTDLRQDLLSARLDRAVRNFADKSDTRSPR